ncbi:hypothetical protein LWI28_004826 [Acer negundo]|uniref:Uncharacterized protein n=1 Tax=Acer negundo TaxID=4023 RepID=A0AAD5NVT5_ACENE|nr:hypothetical protein LWI28_004826 [Acer negundo]
MNPLPDTRKAHALVLQHERQDEVAAKRNITGHHAAHWSEPKPQNQSTESNLNWLTVGSRKDLHCSHCNMNGHTINRYYFLHGFPPRYKLHGKDVKPRGKKSINSLVTSNEEMPKTKQFTVKEYDQIMTLIRKETSNTESYIITLEAMTAPSVVRFGIDIPRPPGNLQTTRFITPPPPTPGSFHYQLNLIDISVGPRHIQFSQDFFRIREDGTGGCIIDSGALIPQRDQNTVGRNAYRAVMYGSGGSSGNTKGVVSMESFVFPTNRGQSTTTIITFGYCSNDNQNFASFQRNGYISGIMGLDLSPSSLTKQSQTEIGKRLTYCVVPFIGVPAPDISVWLHRLHLPPNAFRRIPGGTTIGLFIYSGVPITRIIAQHTNGVDAYGVVMRTFEEYYDSKHLHRRGRRGGFRSCYNKQPGFDAFPTLTYHFQGADYGVDGKNVNFNYNQEKKVFSV